MSDVLDILEKRGFVYQTTDDSNERTNLRKLLCGKPITLYVGIDPTATSMHVGNLVFVMALMHFQRAGHRPIVVFGGGTGLVGDPSGKTELRKLLAKDAVQENLDSMRGQLERFISFDNDAALMFNNADWLTNINYLDFLRDIGRHFSVNRMLTHDCFRTRLDSDSGLSFLEFNYMLLQSYDFYVLRRDHNCVLQVGGSDQWGNMVSGVELIRRVDGEEAHTLTFPLIKTARGQKMGKTEKGAVWLDPELTSPYDYYQFWINTDDSQVGQFLRLFTLLDLERIAELEALEGADIRQAKEVLAYEATKVAHNEEEADKAREAAKALFSKGSGAAAADMPTHSIDASALEGDGLTAVVLCVEGGLRNSRNEARRLAQQGGLYVNDEAVVADRKIAAADFTDGALLMRAGKKKYLRVLLK
jgi:tyrosyl-tRNA synthetase